MRKIYLFDLGLLVAAGTVAAVLTARPVSTDADDEPEDAAPVIASEARDAGPAPQAFPDRGMPREEDDPGSQ